MQNGRTIPVKNGILLPRKLSKKERKRNPHLKAKPKPLKIKK
jgi:hypothetical protein